jgi:S-adenosylmethionine:tRNA ribosyltransferase-isomerase
MLTADFDYALPPELIAQEACEPRDAARLLVTIGDAEVQHRRVSDLAEFLRPGDLLVLNRTKVIPARLFARTPRLESGEGGGEREILLLHPEHLLDADADRRAWRAMVRGRVAQGAVLEVLAGRAVAAEVTVVHLHEDGTRTLHAEDFLALAELCGHVPLPPYIARPDRPSDRERYQTVFADRPGSVAAPTASLHLTTALLERCTALGVAQARVELAIGPGTFKPVDTERVEDFRIHGEWCSCPAETVAAVQATRAAGGRVIAVGTTVARTLESAARQPGGFAPYCGWTRLFMHPPERFHVIDGLLTNFHLPRSSLLMLVACLTGVERLQHIYAAAVQERYRFFSYGDAMLLLPGPSEARGTPVASPADPGRETS